MITTESENKVCAIKNHVIHGIGLVFQEIDKTSSRNKISMLRHSSCFMQNSSLCTSVRTCLELAITNNLVASSGDRETLLIITCWALMEFAWWSFPNCLSLVSTLVICCILLHSGLQTCPLQCQNQSVQ